MWRTLMAMFSAVWSDMKIRCLKCYDITYAPCVLTYELSGFGGLEVACWPLVPKFAGSHTRPKPSNF